jgi:hypothetical protein
MRAWVLALLLSGCGSGADGGPGEFAGNWDANWSSTATIAGATVPYTDRGVIVITTGAGTDFNAAITNSTQSFCTGTFNRTGNTAMFFPPTQSWSGTLINGSRQTNQDHCTAAVNGNSLTISCNGTISGTTAQGVAYNGTYTGSWTGARK